MCFYSSAQYVCKSVGTKEPFTWLTQTGYPRYTNMAAVLQFFWNINMAAMMSCEDPQIAIGHHITSPYLIELSFAFKNTSKTL